MKRNSTRLNVGLIAGLIAAGGLIFGLLLLLIVWRIWPGGHAVPAQPTLESTATPAPVSPSPGQQPAPPQPNSSDPASKSKPKAHVLATAWEMEPDPGVWDVSWQPPADFTWRFPEGVARDAKGRLKKGYSDCISPGTLCPFVAVSLPDQSFDVLNLATGAVLQRLGPFAQHQRLDPALSPDGKRFAVLLIENRSPTESQVAVYSVDSGQQQLSVPVRTPDYHYFQASKRFPLCFAGDEHLLLRNRDWLIRIDLTERRMGPAEPLAKPGFEPKGSLRIPCERGVRALSPGGRYLVTRDADGRSLHVLDIPAWRMVADIPFPDGFTMFWGEVGFSPDGRRLAYAVRQTGPKGGLVQELDVASGQILCSVAWTVPDPPRTQSTTWHDQNPLNGLDYLPGEAGWLIAGNYIVARGSGHADIFSSLRFSVADRRVYREDAVRPCVMPDASLLMESQDSQGLSLRCVPLLDAIDNPDCRLAVSEAVGIGQPAGGEAAVAATGGTGTPGTETQPAPEAPEHETVEPLQGTIAEARFGGRYAVLRYPPADAGNDRLVIVDLCEPNHRDVIQLEAANAGFAVGNSKLVIACNDPPRLQRWDLASGGLEKQRELLVAPSSSILRIGMGACSEGPIWLLIRRRRTDDAWYLYFGDLDSLEVVDAQSAESGNARVYSRSKLPSMQVSPDGSTLLTWLVSESSRYRDKLYVNRYERTASGVQVQEAFLDRAEPILSRDGRHVFMRSAVFDASLQPQQAAGLADANAMIVPTADSDLRAVVSIPATHSPQNTLVQVRDGETSLFEFRGHALSTPNIDIGTPLADRCYLSQQAGVFATVPVSGDHLRITRLPADRFAGTDPQLEAPSTPAEVAEIETGGSEPTKPADWHVEIDPPRAPVNWQPAEDIDWLLMDRDQGSIARSIHLRVQRAAPHSRFFTVDAFQNQRGQCAILDAAAGGDAVLFPRRSASTIGRTAISTDGQLLAYPEAGPSELDDAALAIASLRTGRRLHVVRDAAETVFALSPRGLSRLQFLDERRLLLIERDSVILVDALQGEVLQRAAFDDLGVADKSRRSETPLAAVSPGGRYLVLADPEGPRLCFWDTRQWKEAGSLRPPDNSGIPATCKAAFDAEGKRFAYRTNLEQTAFELLIEVDVLTGRTQDVTRLELVRTLNRANPAWEEGFELLAWLPADLGWLLQGNHVLLRGQQAPQPLDLPESAIAAVLPDLTLLVQHRTEHGEWHLRQVPLEDLREEPEFREMIVHSRAGLALVATTDAAAESPPDVTAQAVQLPEDEGLPPLTAWTAAKSKFSRFQDVTEWSYKPAGMLPPQAVSAWAERLALLGAEPFERWFFSAPESAKLVGYGRAAQAASGPGLPGVQHPFPVAVDNDIYEIRRFDTITGAQDGLLRPPFATEPLCLSLHGRIICCRGKDKLRGRLDLFLLDDGRHLLGFRPYSDEVAFQQGFTPTWVEHAEFVANNQLLTMNGPGKLVLWELPSCRVLWAVQRDPTTRASYVADLAHRLPAIAPTANAVMGRFVLAPDCTTAAVSDEEHIHLMSTADGRCVATLPNHPPGEPDMQVYYVAFDQTGRRLAALHVSGLAEPTARDQHRYWLTIYSLLNGTVFMNRRLATRSQRLWWTPNGQLLVHQEDRSPDAAFSSPDTEEHAMLESAGTATAVRPRYLLFDLVKQGVVWQYTLSPELVSGKLLGGFPNGRFFYDARIDPHHPPRVVATMLPDPESSRAFQDLPKLEPALADRGYGESALGPNGPELPRLYDAEER